MLEDSTMRSRRGFVIYQAEDGIRDVAVTGVQTCALPISISGPPLTAIARIPRGKGERRIRPCQDQSPTSARFSGNHTVEPSIRRRWLPDLSKTRARCGIRLTSANT